MKKIFLAIFLIFACKSTFFAQKNTLYDDTKIYSIFIKMENDSLNLLLKSGNEQSNHYFPAFFLYVDENNKKDTVAKVGIRLRGNTSRTAAKKSFKISFDEFVSTQKYQGVKKLNLNGQHNDPTQIREKLFYDIWKKAGNPERRANFVKLYINGEYKGLYTNIEEIDKDWLRKAYNDDKGNLYKCTYPADLVYKDDDQNSYKKILNNPTTRAYDLQTNQTADDYSSFVKLLKIINQPIDSQYVTNLENIINVESVLKAFALDVALGNWDNYGYNKNNYFLYENQKTKKFEYITYDTDNTIGVDWLGKDWATRNCNAWLPTGTAEKRPLWSKLMQVKKYKTFYNEELSRVTKNITRPDSINPRVNLLHDLVKSSVYNDIYKSFDWQYSNTSFENGFTATVDGHTPYGIKPFFAKRYTSTLAQVIVKNEEIEEEKNFTIFPNPTDGFVFFDQKNEYNIMEVKAFSLEGKFLGNLKIEQNKIDVSSFPNGNFILHFIGNQKTFVKKISKNL